jgi:chromosome segregation protein
MKFTRLRLSGFKSFVEPTEFVIEAGLTGIVGPNGCGKSNLLEALRWVMGESSYKSMRASGMDDVIFSGTATRPSRNMAEVTVALDNAARTAPPAFNDTEIIEISRRIEREAGSAYRINGRDARARDVQLLFADASTGARSPALVRQGQIGEIINSKPQARRRILEEAAGITGLHTRRHEAELKLHAAETNLERIDDVVAQLETQHNNLKRQARQASRYKQLSADIRRLEATTLFATWRELDAAVGHEGRALDEVTRRLAEETRAVSGKSRRRDAADEALPALREAETVRAAVLQRLTIEREGLDKEEAQGRQRVAELESRLTQIKQDLQRESDILNDTDSVLERLAGEEKELAAADSDAAGQRSAAARTLQAAADQLKRSQDEADAASSQLSALVAQADALTRAVAEQGARSARLEAELQAVTARRSALMSEADEGRQGPALAAAVTAASAAAAAAEAQARAAETRARSAQADEASARQTYDEARRRAERQATEVATLAKLLAVADGDLFPPLIDAVKVEAGYEAALAAALSEELDAPIDETSPVHWRNLGPLALTAALPEGAEALARFVAAPAPLDRRLSHTGIVQRRDGPRLQGLLTPGQRLVSREGDLWRWDGYSAAAEAPTAAAKRLAERNRLGALEIESNQAQRQADALKAAFETARGASEEAGRQERAGREAWRRATAAIETARQALSHHEKAMGERLRQVSAMDEAVRRISEQLGEAKAAQARSETDLKGLGDTATLQEKLTALRASVDRDRADYADARARHDGIEHEARARAERLKAIAAEARQWSERAAKARTQAEVLDKRAAQTSQDLAGLADLPARFAARRGKLLTALGEAEAARRQAADRLAEAEAALKAAAADLAQAQDRLATAREDHARASTRLEATRERLAESVARIRDQLLCAPADIPEQAGIDVAKLPEPAAVERKLQDLKDQRERLGGVNLRAEEEAVEVGAQLDGLTAERDDLVAAIAKLRQGISSLNREGRQRLIEAFEMVNNNFGSLFTTLFGGGRAELQLVESEDPLEAGLEILAHPPGKRPQVLSLLSGGEQALTALALIFAVFLTNPSPICVLDEVDAPLDDHNVERFCNLLEAMLQRTDTRFLIITHHALTMARMHRLYGVTMMERGVSQLVSVDLQTAEGLREAS